MTTEHALVRSQDRMIAGVVSGLAHHFGWPVDRTRVGFVLLSVLSAGFPGILVYLLLWLVMPEEGRPRGRFQLDEPAARDRIPPE
jgi:phage shock protein C